MERMLNETTEFFYENRVFLFICMDSSISMLLPPAMIASNCSNMNVANGKFQITNIVSCL